MVNDAELVENMFKHTKPVAKDRFAKETTRIVVKEVEVQKRGGYSPIATGPAPTKPPARSGPPAPLPKEYKFKRKKRKDLVNAMQIVVYSLTDHEVDPKLRKEIEDLVSDAIKKNKDSKQLAYTIVKE